MGNDFILLAQVVSVRRQSDKGLTTELQDDLHWIQNRMDAALADVPQLTSDWRIEIRPVSLEMGLETIASFEDLLIQSEHPYMLCYVLFDAEQCGASIAPASAGSAVEKRKAALDALDQMLRNKVPAVHVMSGNPRLNRMLNSLFGLMFTLQEKWHEKDYSFIAEFMATPDYKLVADRLGKNRGTVWRKEKSLRIREYLTLRKLIKDLVLESK